MKNGKRQNTVMYYVKNVSNILYRHETYDIVYNSWPFLSTDKYSKFCDVKTKAKSN